MSLSRVANTIFLMWAANRTGELAAWYASGLELIHELEDAR